MAYGLYGLGRWLFIGGTVSAVDNADWILRLERTLHVAIERPVQHALDFGLPIRILNYVYLAAQLVAVPAVLVWLYASAPEIYRTLRNTVLVTWVLAIPVYALFPVAPPRLAHIGIIDTLASSDRVSLSSHLATTLYNPLAAVPSLHVGFAFAVSIAGAASLRRLWAQGLFLTWGPLVTIAVVATGNHFVFDVLTGIAITAIGYIGGLLLARGLRPRPRSASPPGSLATAPSAIS